MVCGAIVHRLSVVVWFVSVAALSPIRVVARRLIIGLMALWGIWIVIVVVLGLVASLLRVWISICHV